MAEGLVNKFKDVAGNLAATGKAETEETQGAYYKAAAKKLRRDMEHVEPDEPPQHGQRDGRQE